MHNRTHHSRSSGNGTAIKDDLRRLQADVGTVAQDAMMIGHKAPTVLKERIQSEFTDLGAMAKEQGTQALESARSQIIAHPLTSVAALFGTGVVVGWLLHR